MQIRPRTDDDIAELVAVMSRQQPLTRYPVRWPPPFPPEAFIKRPDEIGAWVAELDGRLAGHISARTVPAQPIEVSAGDEAAVWTAGTGLPRERLGSISALFVDTDATGHGIGTALHDVAVEAIRAAGLVPVLDVVTQNATAVRLYRRKGWRTVGTSRPDWLPPEWEPVLFMVLD